MPVSGQPALSPERPGCSGGRPPSPPASEPLTAGHPPGGNRRGYIEKVSTEGKECCGLEVILHLGFERENLVGQLFLLFFQQLVDLVGFNSLAHQLEVGVVLLP